MKREEESHEIYLLTSVIELRNAILASSPMTHSPARTGRYIRSLVALSMMVPSLASISNWTLRPRISSSLLFVRTLKKMKSPIALENKSIGFWFSIEGSQGKYLPPNIFASFCSTTLTGWSATAWCSSVLTTGAVP